MNRVRIIEAEMDREVDRLRAEGSRTPIWDWCQANPDKARVLLDAYPVS